jgi:hypothetical protein
LRDRLDRAIRKIIDVYEGLDPAATCVLYESSARSTVDCFGRPKLQNGLLLPIEEIAAELRQSIRVFAFRLEKDKTGYGDQHPDGRLGVFRRLSEKLEQEGGPSFCD